MFAYKIKTLAEFVCEITNVAVNITNIYILENCQ